MTNSTPLPSSHLPSGPLPSGQGRRSERQVMPTGTPIKLHLPKGGSGVASLYDINEGGACAVRRGKLDVKIGDVVEIEVAEYQNALLEQPMEEGRRMRAIVRWSKPGQSSSKIGVSFLGDEAERRTFVEFTKMARSEL